MRNDGDLGAQPKIDHVSLAAVRPIKSSKDEIGHDLSITVHFQGAHPEFSCIAIDSQGDSQ